jgi:hypothetical protein
MLACEGSFLQRNCLLPNRMSRGQKRRKIRFQYPGTAALRQRDVDGKPTNNLEGAETVLQAAGQNESEGKDSDCNSKRVGFFASPSGGNWFSEDATNTLRAYGVPRARVMERPPTTRHEPILMRTTQRFGDFDRAFM